MMIFYLILVFILIVFISSKHLQTKQKSSKLPPSPTPLPIIGHLHLLKGRQHKALQTLSKKYGPIMYLHLGSRPTLVISSSSIAEELFTKCDIAFANRPDYISGKHLGYNFTTLGFAPYGDFWRNMRRVTTINIFSSLSLQNSSNIRTDEVRFYAKKLCSGAEMDTWKEVNLSNFFRELVFNIIMRMVGGRRLSTSEDPFEVVPFMNICDYVPILRWIGFGGHEKKLISAYKKRDKFLQGLIDEGRRNRDERSCSIEKQNMTIVEALLALQDAEPEYYTDDIVKGMILIMFTAGIDTSSLTMQWAMSLMLNHPDVLKKAKNEIDTHVTQGHLLEEPDIPKLTYLRCIINETLRLFPIAPLLVPHHSWTDCKINGYNVPAGADLLVNAWAIHRDPEVWEEPLKFKPERFEGVEMGCEGFKFLPFGKGRRACPGSNLAMRSVGLALGTLIQCFEWERVEDSMVDLEEKGGILTIHRENPLLALYKPRLHVIHSIS